MLPKTEAVAARWREAILESCGPLNLKKDAHLCQEHFRAGVDYDILPGGKPLRRQNAVPSIFPTQSTPCPPTQHEQPAAVALLRDQRKKRRLIIDGTPVTSGRMKKGRLMISSRKVLHDNSNCPRLFPTPNEYVLVDVSPVEVEVESTPPTHEDENTVLSTGIVPPVVCPDDKDENSQSIDRILVKVVSTPRGSRTVRCNLEDPCNQSVMSPTISCGRKAETPDYVWHRPSRRKRVAHETLLRHDHSYVRCNLEDSCDQSVMSPTSSCGRKAGTPDYVWHRPSRRKRDAHETPRHHDHSYAKFGVTPSWL